MWSAWSERVALHLGPGAASVKVGRKDAVVVPHASTLPLERALAKLDELVPKQSKLRITLGGALCSMIDFTVPQGVTRVHELREIARAAAQADMGEDAGPLVCEVDASRPGTAAAMAVPVLEAIQHWAVQRGCRIVSIRPEAAAAPLQIDFVADRRWRRMWAAAALCCMGLAAFAVWQWWQAEQDARHTNDQIAIVNQQLARLQVPPPTSDDPMRASAVQAAALLQQDLNKAFATVENLKEPGARLRSFSLDAAAGVLRLEFELDSIARAASLTMVLNAGNDAHPWQLQSVSGASTGNVAAASAPAQPLGIWSAQLGRL